MIIVYCLDENYIRYADISIRTIKKFNPEARIFTFSEEKIYVNDFVEKGFIINLPRIFRNRGIGDRITNTAYLKLFLTKLPFDKIVYLDGDTECQSNLDELWNMKCKYICLTESHSFGKKQAKAIGSEKYGLTGMMLMNLKALRDIDFTEKCLDVEQNYPTPETGWQHDETCINVAMKDKLTFIDKKWNYCKNRVYDNPIREQDAKILHYVGRQKDDMNYQYTWLSGLLKDITGKRVAIIGNAKSIFDKKSGKDIDSHDFIIRFNCGFIKDNESQGSKTDMLMLARDMDKKDILLYNSKWVVNRSRHYNNEADYIVPNIDRSRMRDILNAQPSTGFMAIDLCLYANAKSIDLYGFDFEKTPTFYNPEGYQTQHKYSNEEKIVLEYAKEGLVNIN